MNQDQLELPAHLNARHQHTYDAIFRYPAAHNLEWHNVRSLLEAVAVVAEGHNGTLKVTRNGQTMVLHVPKNKDITAVDDLPAIRRFLEQSAETSTPAPIAAGVHLLVVIDHHEAKIYRTLLDGSVPQQLVPYDPHGFGRHLRSENPETAGKREPERKSYYEAIINTLRGADEILILGSGTGESSAMAHLLAELKHNHGDVAHHVVGSIVVDEHHLTEGQALAQRGNSSRQSVVKSVGPSLSDGPAGSFSHARRALTLSRHTGFVKCASKPASRDRHRSSSSSYPESATKREPLRPVSWRRCEASSRPPMTGMLMSHITTSGGCSTARASVSWPSYAVLTSWPSRRSNIAMQSAASRLSSTTRIRRVSVVIFVLYSELNRGRCHHPAPQQKSRRDGRPQGIHHAGLPVNEPPVSRELPFN